jgi:NADH:ubiquinone oxidoreductase subunit 2 (subunit N)
MHLPLLLGIGALGAAVSAWGLAQGGRAARRGAVAGGVALLLLLGLTLTMDVPAPGTLVGDGAADVAAGGLFDGRLVPTAYLRLTIGIWGLDAAVLVFIAWLLGGLPRLRGVLPGTLAAMTGGVVVLASADLAVGAAAAAASGLAALVAVPPNRGGTAVAAAARELRLTIAVGAILLAVVAVAPLTAALTLSGAGAASGATGGATGSATTAGASAMLGLAALAVTLGIGARLGAIPFHVRFSRIADAASPVDLPLLLAWLAVPVVVAGLAIVDGQIAPLALPLEGDRVVVIAVAFVTLVGAALAAFVQDDLRHMAGYLVIADGGLVLLGFAALDPAAWGPARVWLVAMAASKTALIAWAAVAEDRFETRSVPDLRGWLRRSPILATGLVVTVIATFGIPGWVAFEARVTLARLAVNAPWDAVLVLAGFLTLPTYVRLLALGTGLVTSKVDGAAPERIVRRRGEGRSLLKETLVVEVEVTPEGAAGAGADGAAAGAATDGVPAGTAARRSRRPSRGSIPGGASVGTAAATRFGAALRRDRTEILAAAVLALAVLAALTSWGALDIAGAAAEPAPITAGPAGD